MESDRVEMSVGGGMVNGDHLVNGVTSNGSSTTTKSQTGASAAAQPVKNEVMTYTNGDVVPVKKEGDGVVRYEGSILKDAPPELQQVLSSEFYLPMARLISRSAQSCWNDLGALVDRLASMPTQPQSTNNGGISLNDQSRANLDKKDFLLNFAKEHKDVFIKLLVLLQWSRKSDEVRKTIELNLWLQQRRQAFNNATAMLGAMVRGLADSQVPNPDLYTASEVLATGTVSSMPKLDYIPQPTLTSKQIIRVLRRLDVILCTRMALMEDIPIQLRSYHIHDGRITFVVPEEFSFDVSLASEDPEARFGMVDFNFLFSPAPLIPDGLHDEVSYIANAALTKDGFAGAYEFFHDLTLSYKLSEFARQARKLSQGLWSNHLRVEVLRRTLVLQYWVKSSIATSWLEIGIHSGSTQGLHTTTADSPRLNLRWFREGKLADTDRIRINVSELSIEDLLRQVISQHTNQLFDDIYVKLLSSSLYSSAELGLSQSASMIDPSECFLEVQLSKMDTLRISMEPIGGSFVLSPVNERISRLQLELARSRSFVDDFVARLSSLRSSTAESNLIKSLPNSQWQRLEGVKISSSEAEKSFGQAATRITCLRLQDWTQEWMLAVTQSTRGDFWWLVQSVLPNSIAGSRTTKLVADHPLYKLGSPSPAYLERLAEYSTGAISLQCNAESLKRHGLRWKLSNIPAFDSESRLPALQFSRTSILSPNTSKSGLAPATKIVSRSASDSVSSVHLTYHGMGRVSKKVIMVAKAALHADPVVLKDLASSKLDPSIIIIAERQRIMIKLESDAGTAVIESLLSKLSHLENIVACAVAVRRSTEHKLQSLSLSSITILYNAQPELSVRIKFGQHTDDLSATFLPAESNPQRHLSQWVVKSMQRKGQSSSRNLSSIFVVLRMTKPIMSYLHSIQSRLEPDTENSDTAKAHLRVHVLYRQPTAYGLQYFADSANFIQDETGPSTPKKLLVRFEILSVKRGTRLMWMVRPAIEEFNSYNRPSYTSRALRDRLNDEVFQKGSPSWLALDGGAACPSDKPEQLMDAIHNTIVEWTKEAIKPESVTEQTSVTKNATGLDGAADKKPARPNQSSQKAGNPTQRPNGVQRPQQMGNQQRLQSNSTRNPVIKSEVITLDD